MRRVIPALLALVAVAVILWGCSFDPGPYGLEAKVREWYPSQDIVVPIEVYGDWNQYAEYRYEYDDGTGWVVGAERTVLLASGRQGLIRFTATAHSGVSILASTPICAH